MKKTVSVIIPAYKEEKSIEEVISKIIKELENEINFEIIVIVDKAKDDRTDEIVGNLSKDFAQIKMILRNGKNGVAKAIEDGIKEAKNEIIVIAMADGSEDAHELKKIMNKMDEDFDTVYGNRFLNGAGMKNYPGQKYFFNRICNLVIRLIFKIPSTDITNAAKAYKSEILKEIKITSKGFEVFAELPIKSYLLGYKNITEVAIIHDAGMKNTSKFALRKEGIQYVKMVFGCFFNSHN
jgi:dolichol-phosphate mannosyltransferase|tara:strand:+ start:1553 stop:2266 length:714 start_codon:yes stop_codon:yes gene_type:complete